MFDLSRSIDLHKLSTAHTNEEAIAGVTAGLIGMGESVTWRATHFGITQTLTSKITAFHRPYTFTDEMVDGAFQTFIHRHIFEKTVDGKIKMTDIFDYKKSIWGTRQACRCSLPKKVHEGAAYQA